MKNVLSVLIAVSLLVITGCSKPLFVEPGSETVLKGVQFQDTFATARAAMAKRFEIKFADPDTGVIQAKPKLVSAEAERLLGGNSPARKLAKLTVQEKDGNSIIHVSVQLQRQANTSYQQTLPRNNYTGVPNQTPAQKEAATTADQNESWHTQKRDQGTEMEILNEITAVLTP